LAFLALVASAYAAPIYLSSTPGGFRDVDDKGTMLFEAEPGHFETIRANPPYNIPIVLEDMGAGWLKVVPREAESLRAVKSDAMQQGEQLESFGHSTECVEKLPCPPKIVAPAARPAIVPSSPPLVMPSSAPVVVPAASPIVVPATRPKIYRAPAPTVYTQREPRVYEQAPALVYQQPPAQVYLETTPPCAETAQLTTPAVLQTIPTVACVEKAAAPCILVVDKRTEPEKEEPEEEEVEEEEEKEEPKKEEEVETPKEVIPSPPALGDWGGFSVNMPFTGCSGACGFGCGC